MITEEQVLALYNHAGKRTATAAKPRLLILSFAGAQGLNFSTANNERYFFIERIWFSYASSPKPLSSTDFYISVQPAPFEVNISSANTPVCITPVVHNDRSGFAIDGSHMDPYIFARQLSYVTGTQGQGICAHLLIWELEE